MKKVLATLLVGAAIGAPLSAGAWGNEGHQTVGAIADRLLAGKKAAAAVQALLLPGETLESVSIWADCAKGYCGPLTPEMKEFVNANPDHHDYHFTDLPFQFNLYQDDDVGTSERDVVRMVRQCIAVLRGDTSGSANPHGLTPRHALLLLTHLVGDLHQPLHVGTAYINSHDEYVVPATKNEIDEAFIFATQGDNFLLKGSKALHGYWDTQAVKSAMNAAHVASPGAFADYLILHPAALQASSGDALEWPIQWASETVKLSKLAHKNVVPKTRETVQDRHLKSHFAWPVTTPANYLTTAKKTANDQLSRAGARLAAILESIWS